MTDAPDDEIGRPTADPVRSRSAQWMLLVGDRTIVAGAIVAATFLIDFARSPPVASLDHTNQSSVASA